MNLMELVYVTTALGVGAGAALGLGHRYGTAVGILGFFGGVAFVFLLLVLVIAMAKKKRSKSERI